MSVESMEELLGVKFERIEGEVLPPVTAAKRPSEHGDIKIEWIDVSRLREDFKDD